MSSGKIGIREQQLPSRTLAPLQGAAKIAHVLFYLNRSEPTRDSTRHETQDIYSSNRSLYSFNRSLEILNRAPQGQVSEHLK